MKKFLSLCFAIIPWLVFCQTNIHLLSTYTFTGQRLSGCWHYRSSSGHEYGLIGAEQGIAFLDITQPNSPQYLFQLPGNTSIWHEVKVSGDFAYAVSEGIDTNGVKNGVQVMDLRYLPDSVPYHFWQGDGLIAGQLQMGHTITVDDQYIYVNGHNINSLGRGVLICSIADPWNPTYVGAVTQNYSHDSYVRGDLLYSSEIIAGQFAIYDIANRAQPVLLGTQTTPGAFNHNSWLSDNGQVLYTTDERGGFPLASYDVSNPANITQLDAYYTINFPSSEVHNVRVINDYLINPSYGSQLTIVDATRPDNLIEIGSYTTGSFLCWDADPFLASGAILATDMNATAVYLFEPVYQRACYLEGLVSDSVTTFPLPGSSVTIIPTTVTKTSDNQGRFRTGTVNAGTYDVLVSRTGYTSKIVSGVSLQNGVVTSLNVALAPDNIGIDETEFTNLLQVYPNPAARELTIMKKSSDAMQLQLLDFAGKQLLFESLLGEAGTEVMLPLNDVSNGCYLLRLQTSEGVLFQRLVVAH